MKLNRVIYILILLSASSIFKLSALSFTDFSSTLAEIFEGTIDYNEGDTCFRSFMIPFGGRTESLGDAFTGLCDDISFLRYNAAGSCIQNKTQLALYHNSWIADSKMDTLACTTRYNHLGLGAYLSAFYVPFTEYNIYGDRVAGNYYSESTFAANISYNFLAGYTFKGFALGATAKAAWRSIPNFTDNDTNEVISWSGFSQSALGLAADFGLMLQFNIFKYYASREPNFKIGLTAQNMGIALTGAGSSSGLSTEAIPSYFALGLSYKVTNPITISLDYKQPVNLLDISTFRIPYISAGLEVAFTESASFIAGFQLKGAHPRISSGLEFEFSKIIFNFNYTLDLTSSINPLNKFSLSVRLPFGDNGRAEKTKQIDELYSMGLEYYSQQKWDEAIAVWKKILELDKRFDPAIIGITSAQYQIDMLRMIQESLRLDN